VYFYDLMTILICAVIEEVKAYQEAMALVDKRQQNSSNMRNVFIDCQSGHHSHASLIKTLVKVYNNVSVQHFIHVTLCYCSAIHDPFIRVSQVGIGLEFFVCYECIVRSSCFVINHLWRR